MTTAIKIVTLNHTIHPINYYSDLYSRKKHQMYKDSDTATTKFIS